MAWLTVAIEERVRVVDTVPTGQGPESVYRRGVPDTGWRNVRTNPGRPADGRFRRCERLTLPSQFRRVFAGNLRSSDKRMSVLAIPNQLGYPRLGMAMSRKVSPSAVARNRIKRLVRESFRNHKDRLGGLDLVVIGRGTLARSTNSEIRRTLEHHWMKLARYA